MGKKQKSRSWLVELVNPMDAWALVAAVRGLAGLLGPGRAEDFSALVEMLDLTGHIGPARDSLRRRPEVIP